MYCGHFYFILFPFLDLQMLYCIRVKYFRRFEELHDTGININQSRTNGPINAHLTIAQVMPRYNHNNEKQEALL